MPQNKIITLIGGTGFVGRYAVRSLAKAGYRLRVVSRSPERALPLKTAGELGQISLLSGDISRPETIAPHLAGSHAVIDLVGILYETRRRRFSALHTDAAGKLAEMARAAGVRSFIYMSALGADHATNSTYARSKLAGEQAVRTVFPGAITVRPSIIFGPEDDFLNRFARLSVVSPVLPLLGGGKTHFQPVYAGDVARALRACLSLPVAGETFELGGPRVYTFRALMEYILQQTHRRCWLPSVPFGLAETMAMFMPKSVLTRDQVRLLHHDSVVNPELPGLNALGLQATALESVAPQYLARYRPYSALAALEEGVTT